VHGCFHLSVLADAAMHRRRELMPGQTQGKEVQWVHEYELALVIQPDLEDEAIAATTERLTSLVTSRGGEVTAVDTWGRRRLAYPIRRFKDGFYTFAKLRMAPDQVEELDRAIKVTESVLRHLIIRIDD